MNTLCLTSHFTVLQRGCSRVPECQNTPRFPLLLLLCYAFSTVTGQSAAGLWDTEMHLGSDFRSVMVALARMNSEQPCEKQKIIMCVSSGGETNIHWNINSSGEGEA